MKPSSTLWLVSVVSTVLTITVAISSTYIIGQRVFATLLDKNTLTDQSNLGGLLLPNETDNGQQTNQEVTDQQVQQQDFAKDSTKNVTTTENEAQIDKNPNSNDLTGLLNSPSDQKSGSGIPLPCPPFCKPLPPPCPPLCAQTDTSERVSNPYADVIYRDGPIITNNSTGQSDKIASSGCHPGELLVGGGWKSKNLEVQVQSSFGQKNEWFVQFHGPVDLQAFALCLRFNAR
jgi:hypothetical protein